MTEPERLSDIDLWMRDRLTERQFLWWQLWSIVVDLAIQAMALAWILERVFERVTR
jgi:hypothetical protein